MPACRFSLDRGDRGRADLQVLGDRLVRRPRGVDVEDEIADLMRDLILQFDRTFQAVASISGSTLEQRRLCQRTLRPLMILSRTTTMAITMRIWMNPPMVYEVSSPKSRMIRTTAIV